MTGPESAAAPTEPELRAHVRPPRRGSQRPSAVRLGSVPLDSREDMRFVQDRLALFAKTTFLVSAGLLAVTTVSDLVNTVQRYTDHARASHAAGVVLAFAVWSVARGRRILTASALDRLDIAATLGICWAFTLMGHYSVQPYGFYTGLISVIHVTVTRAMILPSTPRASALLAGAAFAGLILSRLLMPWPAEIAALAGTRGRGVLEAVLWSAAGITVSTVASAVIYGLREKALEIRKLGQYTLEEKIGEGGMGEVYRARHAMLRRPTAVKLLVGDGYGSELRRFEKEVQLTAQLTHPNTISIYDYGRTPDGVFYYAMELLEGLTLEALVERHGAQPAGRVIHLLRQVCGALREAHRAGLIHRDIKPANVFLSQRGQIPDFVKVLDFGLVRELRPGDDLTRSNLDTIVGTPLYLAPEAIASPDTLDARADLYALGCVAYFLVTGRPPFLGATAVEVCAHHLHSPAEPPSRLVSLPADLERVILWCLEKDVGRRPESAEALARALEECAAAREWTEGRAQMWWSSLPASAAAKSSPEHAAESGRKPRRTVCCVDLEARLEIENKSA